MWYYNHISKADKIFVQMKNSPQGDWQIETLKAVAKRHNVEWRQPGTSHVTFRRADGAKLTVPAHRPIKPIYIKQFVRFIEGG
jgi:predicted RNA binding protein YcfA (HicA-like mRNA interferase family)